MKIITLLNEKGGVGKTTLCGTLGVGLALRGFRVLLIDADAQGNLTENMGLPKTHHFYDFVKRPASELKSLIRRVPQDTCSGHLYIVSGNEETAGLPNVVRVPEAIKAMASRLRQLERAFDYVVIDTSPTPNSLHDAMSILTDWIILPTDAEVFSVESGLKSSIEHTSSNRQDALERGLDKGKILGIVVNKFRSVGLHQMFWERLIEKYGELVWDAIPLRVLISESQLKRNFLMQDAPHHETTAFLWKFIDRVILETGGNHVQEEN